MARTRAHQKRIDLTIDRVVERLNRGSHPKLDPLDVPPFLRVGPHSEDIFEEVAWTIRPAPSRCDWIDAFEDRLPGTLPPSFKSLVTRYLFPVLDLGPVRLFANTGVHVHFELVDAAFRDAGIHEPAMRAGFVQFGQPDEVNYDPVCFDLNRKANDGECPIIQLDHEAALTKGRVRVIRELAPSFLALLGK
jgi:hypothetical protein